MYLIQIVICILILYDAFILFTNNNFYEFFAEIWWRDNFASWLGLRNDVIAQIHHLATNQPSSGNFSWQLVGNTAYN